MISSPPFGFHQGGGGINTRGYRKNGTTGPSDDKVGERTYQGTAGERTAGNLETLVLGDVSAVVGSPPYEGSLHASENGIDWSKARNGNDGGSQTPGASVGAAMPAPHHRTRLDSSSCTHQFQDTTYCLLCGWEPPADAIEQIEAAARRDVLHGVLPVLQLPDDLPAVSGDGRTAPAARLPAAVVSSPPYENIERANHAPGESARRAREGRADQAVSYGTAAGNLGNVEGQTFWAAALQIVTEAYAVLKPGGYAVWVTKRFIRDGKIQPFDDDWRRLCEFVGFETVQEVHAMLVAEERRDGLFGETVKRRERKGFFRRLAEKKGSPRIDYEVVWFLVKPA